jgi:tetratricopeptide (TPR) repeat protein
MRRVVLLFLLPAILAADDHWVKFTSGPFEVFTDAGPRAGRETMVRFLEFRHAVGQILGENELQTPLPVRILVFKNAREWNSMGPISEGRAQYNIVLQEKSAPSTAINSELAQLFLKANTAQMPPAFERGLVAFFSTTEINGIQITVGAPPPKPDEDWARIHLLVTSPEYFGKIRVLMANLRRGVDEEPAYRNAFGKTPAEIEFHVKQHFASGKFPTTTLSSRPLSERDFPERAVSDADARLARGDLLAGKASAAEYQTLLKDGAKIPEAEEGLGLLALYSGAKDEARQHFSRSIEAGSSSARAFIEYAKLEPDNEKAAQALLKAAGINPKLDEPFALMAQRDTDARKRLAHWKAAAERNPRNASYWQSLAEAYLADHNYSEAAKAWKQGEQAATDPAVRERMHAARVSIEQQRLDYEADEKKRAADEEARDLERLKAQARAEVKALESKYNKGTAKSDAPVVPWWDGPKPDKRAAGTLKQIDCLGKQARLTMQTDDGATVKLLVPDPGKITVINGNEQSLACGGQKARRVTIEYWTKSNPRLGTAGEVATIEFQ